MPDHSEVERLRDKIEQVLPGCGENPKIIAPWVRQLIAVVRDERDQEWLNEMSRQITPVEGEPGMAMTEVIHKGLAARMGYEQRRKKWVKRDAS